MNLNDFDKVSELRMELGRALKTLRLFETSTLEAIPTTAFLPHGDCGSQPGSVVDLLPVPRSVVVSAAKREVDELVNELLQFGVTVEFGEA
ncbi:MAG: hypothetical protein JWR07_1919 [Nevskia sp.]|nr:hypothetical protein [Nevskia sp.]